MLTCKDKTVNATHNVSDIHQIMCTPLEHYSD